MLSITECKNNSFYVAFGQLPPFEEHETIKLTTVGEVYDCLKSRIPKGQIGLMLSSGRDSLILAACLPKGTMTYTARLEGKRDESINAARIARKLGLKHKVVDITWADYKFSKMTLLQKHPLLCCPWTYKVARRAKRDGINILISGVGTLGSFGESADYHDLANEPKKFLKAWAKHIPEKVLKEPYPLIELCREYITDGKIDTVHFMSLGRGEEVVMNATIQFAGLKHIAPYTGLWIDFDINQAQKEGKYLLGELYQRLIGENPPPKRSPSVTNFAQWLKDWKPSHPNFRDDINLDGMEIKRWQLYKLEYYWRLNDKCNRL